MPTADPSLTPDIALGWSVHAVNTLEMIDGISPFMIVFGKNPMHPTLTNFKPGNEDNPPELSKIVADNIKAMIKAREIFCSLEADRVLRQALKQIIYTNSENVRGGDWIYFRQNNSTVWKGPVKVTTREGKRLYILNGGRLNTINIDDVLLCKNDEDMWRVDQEEFVTIPRRQEGDEDDETQNDGNQGAESCNCYNNSIETFTYSTAPKTTVSNVSSSQPPPIISVPTDQEKDVPVELGRDSGRKFST